jgi:hypothetical protein
MPPPEYLDEDGYGAGMHVVAVFLVVIIVVVVVDRGRRDDRDSLGGHDLDRNGLHRLVVVVLAIPRQARAADVSAR